MVKPLYIVFFFFALSLCEQECVTLTLTLNDERKVTECNQKEQNQAVQTEQQQTDKPLVTPTDSGKDAPLNTESQKEVCSKLVNKPLNPNDPNNKEANGLNDILNRLLNNDTTSSDSSKYKFKVTSPSTPENDLSNPLPVCYEVTEKNNNQRVLKRKGINSLSNILPASVDGTNQKPKDSLIMAI